MKRINRSSGMIEIVGPEGDILDRFPISAPQDAAQGPARPFRDRRRPMVSRSKRRRLEIEQGGLCFLCLEPWVNPTVDHVMPRRLFYGDRGEFRNLVIACQACNLAKGGRAPTDAEIARLLALKEPYAEADYDVSAVEPAPRSGWVEAASARRV